MAGWLVLTGLNGALLVALGAIGAHAFAGDGQAKAWFDTAWRYQALHAVALLALSLAVLRIDPGLPRSTLSAGMVLFVLGTALFCGSLYKLAWTGSGLFPMSAPLGGGSLILGWLAVAVAGGLYLRQTA
jgi:uncharacterized membrane protein YgdD (TMEM256/DUF423 family)